MGGLFEVASVAGGALLLVTLAGAAILAPLFKPGQPGWNRGYRRARALSWLYAPYLIPLVLLATAFAQALLGRLFGWADHCFVHDGSLHHHFCVFHPPHLENRWEVWLVLGAVACWVAMSWGRLIRDALAELRITRALVRTSRPSPWGDAVRLLDQDEAIATTAGFWNATVLLSTGFVNQVSPETLKVVLAHEEAHRLRRDTFWGFADTVVASLLPRRARERVLWELGLSRELACDAAAAEREGVLKVAQALTEVARLELAPAPGVSVMASSLSFRVRHLLQPVAAPLWERWGLWIVVSVIAVLAMGPAHLLLEHLVGILLH